MCCKIYSHSNTEKGLTKLSLRKLVKMIEIKINKMIILKLMKSKQTILLFLSAHPYICKYICISLI